MWLLLFLSSTIVGLLTLLLFASKKWFNRIKLSLFSGLALMLLDYAIETWGGFYGYWLSINAGLYLGYIPVELMICAFWIGTLLGLIFPYSEEERVNLAVLPSQTILVLFTCFAGAFFEYILQGMNFMIYANGWNFISSFLSYALVFVIWAQIYYSLAIRIIKTPPQKIFVKLQTPSS